MTGDHDLSAPYCRGDRDCQSLYCQAPTPCASMASATVTKLAMLPLALWAMHWQSGCNGFVGARAHLNPVAAIILAAVKRPVCTVDGAFQPIVLLEFADPHTDGDRDGLAVETPALLHQRLPDPLGTCPRLLQAGIRKNRQKLLAAPARNQILAAQLSLDRVRHLHQHLVADLVAVAVVDELEVIDIQQQQPDGMPAALKACQLLLGQIEHMPAVEQPRQRIGGRHMPQLALCRTDDLQIEERQVTEHGEDHAQIE